MSTILSSTTLFVFFSNSARQQVVVMHIAKLKVRAWIDEKVFFFWLDKDLPSMKPLLQILPLYSNWIDFFPRWNLQGSFLLFVTA